MKYKDKFKLSNDWKEKVFLVSVFHSTRVLKYRTEWSLRKTADYFGVSIALVSENLNIARRFDELGECKSRNDALMKIRGINK